MPKKRRVTEAKGRLAERMVKYYLQIRRWKIIHTRWRHPTGEIDIIATKKGILAFVEVKYSNNQQHIQEIGLAIIKDRQRKRIRKSAEAFIAQLERQNPKAFAKINSFRFDAALVGPKVWQINYQEHLEI